VQGIEKRAVNIQQNLTFIKTFEFQEKWESGPFGKNLTKIVRKFQFPAQA